MTCQCKDCENRAVGCHGKCAPYQTYNAEREKIRNARQQDQIGRYAKLDSIIDWEKTKFRSRRK